MRRCGSASGSLTDKFFISQRSFLFSFYNKNNNNFGTALLFYCCLILIVPFFFSFRFFCYRFLCDTEIHVELAMFKRKKINIYYFHFVAHRIWMPRNRKLVSFSQWTRILFTEKQSQIVFFFWKSQLTTKKKKQKPNWNARRNGQCCLSTVVQSITMKYFGFAHTKLDTVSFLFTLNCFILYAILPGIRLVSHLCRITAFKLQ